MFVNNRYMRHPYFHKALMTAYSGMLLPDHTPSYFLYFDIHPDAIDVNIHPTKTEIKFADEQAIFQILLAATKEALGKFNVAPSLDFTTESQLDIPQRTNNTPSVSLLKSLGFELTGTENVSFYKDAQGNDMVFQGGIFKLNTVR